MNPDLQALPPDNNAAISSFLGVPANWYALIEAACTRYAQGMDIDELTTTVITDLGKSVIDPANRLAQAVQKLKEAGLPPDQTQTQMTRLIRTAASLRARRFSKKRKSQTHASLSGHDEQRIDVTDTRHDENEEQTLNAMKGMVTAELHRMADQADNAQNRQRLLQAVKVAEIRMANPPDFPGLDELVQVFPHIRRTTMFRILGDIQEALERSTADR